MSGTLAWVWWTTIVVSLGSMVGFISAAHANSRRRMRVFTCTGTVGVIAMWVTLAISMGWM